MGKFTRHISLGEKLVLDGEEFIIKPLSIEHLPEFFEAMKGFKNMKGGGNDEENLKKFLDDMTPECSKSIGRLIDETLKLSYPEENEEERKAMGLKYMFQLILKIFEINSANTNNPEIQAKLKALRIKDGQSGQA